MLTRQAFVVRARTTPEDLGRHNDIRSLPSQLLDGLIYNLLDTAVGVDFGVVEEVEADDFI